MSTILKALRRIEDDKGKPAERPLREEVVLAPARRRRSMLAWVVSAAVLGVGAALLAAALRDGFGAPEEPAAAASVAAAPAAPAPAVPSPPIATPQVVAAAPTPIRVAPAPPAVAPPAAAWPRPAGTAAPEPEVAELPIDTFEDDPETPELEMVRPLTARPSSIRDLAADADEPPAPLAPPRSILRSDEPPAPRFSQPDDVAEAAPPPERVPVRTSSLPALRPDPRAARPAAPPAATPRVVRTQWHPSPARRAAWIAFEGGGAREVHEGDRVGAWVVREIEPDGVRFADGASETRAALRP